jgi:hypothetical protein
LKKFHNNYRIALSVGAQGEVMKLLTTLSIFFVFGSLAVGCQLPYPAQTPPSTFPADLEVTYGWNTGSLPPRYHYSYQIVIKADGSGQFIYQQGYTGDGAPVSSVSTFSVLPEKINQLYQLLLTKSFLRTEWAKKEPLIGGSSSEMQILADEKEYSIPNDAVLINQDRSTAAEVYDFIKALVPASIWDDLAKKRQIADAATDVPSP